MRAYRKGIVHSADACLQALQPLLADLERAPDSDTFFQSVTSSLSRILAVSHVFAAELTRGKTHFKTLAFWADGKFLDNFEVPLSGTPCELVSRGEVAHFGDHVQEHFPRNEALRRFGLRSYCGVPLRDASGQLFGHLAVLDAEPMSCPELALSIMRLLSIAATRHIPGAVALRAATVWQERELPQLVDAAVDAVIVADDLGRISWMNAAAGRLLSCDPAQSPGSPLERFLHSERWIRNSRALCRRAGADAALFIRPEDDLRMRRSDGTSAACEGSVSVSAVDDRVYQTFILREVKDSVAASCAERAAPRIVGQSACITRVLKDVRRVGPTTAAVLIRGETGTGKELVAHAIHQASARASGPFVAVNCAALSPSLIESELFGHEKGAFTGALQRRIGRFEAASGGTLFLDEVGELPLEAQAKLLRVLQEQSLERTGSNTTIALDVRVISATNRDLEEAVRTSSFRQDLLFRLNAFPIQVPPLRERTDDLPMLVEHIVQQCAQRMRCEPPQVTTRLLQDLARYEWPGNVRELQNVLERALILCSGPKLELGSAAHWLAGETSPDREDAAPCSPTTLAEIERRHILDVLQATAWRIEGGRGAACRLGLHPNTLRSRMSRQGIRRSLKPRE